MSDLKSLECLSFTDGVYSLHYFQAVEESDAGVYIVKVIKDKKAIAKYSAALLVE